MLNISDIKQGRFLAVKGSPYEVIRADHSIHGRGGAVLKTKLRNLRNGNVIDQTFKGNDTAEEADLETERATFLYSDGEKYSFMNESTYEQFDLPEAQVGEAKAYLVEQAPVRLMKFDGVPIKLDLPIKMDFSVTEAPPGVKGNTAAQGGGNKEVTIETGATVSTPLFIKVGDRIRVTRRPGNTWRRRTDTISVIPSEGTIGVPKPRDRFDFRILYTYKGSLHCAPDGLRSG